MDVPTTMTRSEALASGLTDADLRTACRRGELRRIRRGHYLDADTAARCSPEVRHLVVAHAVMSRSSNGTALSRISAGLVHALQFWNVGLGTVHVTKNRPNGGRVKPKLIIHSEHIEPDEITIVDGLRVTTPPRTIIDIARTSRSKRRSSPGTPRCGWV